MATRVFCLPDLGEGLTEAELVRWIVAVGDEVAVDQPIAEVETAKSIVEVPSPFAGTVAALHGEEGQTLAVGSPFLEVMDAGATEAASAPAGSEHEAHRVEERGGSGNVLIGYGTTDHHARGRTRRRAQSAPAAETAPRATTPLTPAIPPTESVDRPSGPVPVRSPIVRSLARSRGIDLHTIRPAAPDGIIRRSDVLDAGHVAPAHGADDGPDDLEIVRREPLGTLRRTVAAKLARSRSEIPEATVWVDVDATALWQLRQSMGNARPSLTAFVAKYVLLALAEHPVLCGRLSDDGTELVQYDGVNLGVAADTPRGLLVPVLRHAERQSIAELDTHIRRLADSARSGTAAPAELTGSTFTLNNYGSLGVDGSAAIINYPEVAILGVGRMIERPWVVDGAIVPRRIVQLSLVFDHRVCDGGYAARFLGSIVRAIENPFTLYDRI
ncbi:dihydrolipoamide acetyltransferase family protein [Leifsonia sp. YIM 134122]|uniref:Dihydrolipoamide acetyltransferase component of pyruvate dehydrogenase complex n=1 Tax=Leifsonia stereocauli TaxID=3134136 RepID=A0ABU9W468_9MICO